MADTTIEWTQKVWNPTRGCSRVSSGCTRCYAERQAARFAGPGNPFEGFVTRVNGHAAWTGKVALVEKHLNDPLHWKTPRKIFVNSMSDLFHEDLPWAAIDKIWQVMLDAPQHTYQILTKRPEVMLEYLTTDTVGGRAHFGVKPHWIWLGVSVEDQNTANKRVPLLLQTPANVRFVSYEPALGPVDFRRIEHEPKGSGGTCFINALDGTFITVGGGGRIGKLDQIIVGGESGPGARPFDTAWARSTVEQCKAAGVSVFVKQLGAHVIQDGERRHKKDKKGGDMHEWPHDLRVIEFPESA